MTPRPARRSFAPAAFALATVAVILLPTTVLGHAELDAMSPADKSTVAFASVTQIVATFTEDLDPSGSNLALVDAAGTVVAKGGTVDATNKKKLTLDLSSTALDEETYTVRWTSKSAQDGDLDRGTTTFVVIAGPSTVASPSPGAASSTQASSASLSTALSAAPSPSPSGGTGTPTSSTDALIPIVVVLVVIAALGLWLLRGRSRPVA